VPRTAADFVVAAALARSIAKPLKSSQGEYKYDATLQVAKKWHMLILFKRNSKRWIEQIKKLKIDTTYVSGARPGPLKEGRKKCSVPRWLKLPPVLEPWPLQDIV